MPSSKRQMLRSSMVVGFFSFLASLTGILVETSIAAKLGLSRSSDTFYVAFTVPYIITNLTAATGQFSLVPFFSTLEARHSADELWHGFSYVVNAVFVGSGVIAIIGVVAAPWVVRGIAPGFNRPETQHAAELCRWLFLIIIPAGVAETFRSFLLSQHRFALSSGANFFRNTTVILSVLFAFKHYGDYSIVIGYSAGYLLQLGMLAGQVLLAFPVRYGLTLSGRGEAFRNLRGAGATQLLGALGWQVVVIVERIIASFLVPGTLTALNYGFKIVSTLSELLAGSVGTAALPALSRAVARQAESEERNTFRHALEIGLVTTSPVAVFCMVLPHPIMRLVFERGNFVPEATALMSRVFFYYSLSLFLLSGFRILSFYIFARQETPVFLRLCVLYYGLVIAFDLLYVGVLGLGAIGIPLGLLTALVVTVGLTLLRNLVGLKNILDRPLGVFAGKILAGGALAAVVMWLLRLQLESPLSSFANFVYLCELCGVGSLIFLGTLAASRVITKSQFAAMWQDLKGS